MSGFIDATFSAQTFTMLPGMEAINYLHEIGDELEKICFNIIAYSEVSTFKPLCYVEMITNEQGSEIKVKDNLSFVNKIEIRPEIEASEFYDSIMSKNIPLSENKATYKELFLCFIILIK